ncbi:MAG: hypothetical protein ACREQ5_11710 [Candidatus Dormibacteria bacterium]
MEQRKSMATKHVSLANLAVNAPETRKPDSKLASNKVSRKAGEQDREQQEHEGKTPVQISFRVNRDAYRDLKRMALDEDLTLKELVIRAINERRERMGLKKLPL